MADPRSEFAQAYEELLNAVKFRVGIDQMTALERDESARAVIRRYTTALQAKIVRDVTSPLRRADRTETR